MFDVPLVPKFNVKYVKSVTLEAFKKNHEGIYSDKLLEAEWKKHNPKKEEKSEKAK